MRVRKALAVYYGNKISIFSLHNDYIQSIKYEGGNLVSIPRHFCRFVFLKRINAIGRPLRLNVGFTNIYPVKSI